MIETCVAGAASAIYARLQPEADASLTFNRSRIKHHSKSVGRSVQTVQDARNVYYVTAERFKAWYGML